MLAAASHDREPRPVLSEMASEAVEKEMGCLALRLVNACRAMVLCVVKCLLNSATQSSQNEERRSTFRSHEMECMPSVKVTEDESRSGWYVQQRLME